MDNDEKKSVTKNNVEFVEKKNKKINQRPKKEKLPNIKNDPDKSNIRNVIWVILLFVIMFAVLMALPYISNYR